MGKTIEFSRLPIELSRDGDTIVAYRNGRVVRIPVPSSGADPAGLATVATTGKYSDLTGLPVLGTAASKADSYFATADQGSKGVTAYLWGNHASVGYALASSVTQALAQKVDAAAGKGLSANDFTNDYKSAIDGLGNASTKNVATTALELDRLITTAQAKMAALKSAGVYLSGSNPRIVDLDSLEENYQGLAASTKLLSVKPLPFSSPFYYVECQNQYSGNTAQIQFLYGYGISKIAFRCYRNTQATNPPDWVEIASAADLNLLAQELASLRADMGDLAGAADQLNQLSMDLISLSESLGTAAFATLTTSDRDSSIGRVLRVGDFGLGVNTSPVIPTNSDLNSLTQNGIYTVAGAYLNGPAGLGTLTGTIEVKSRAYTAGPGCVQILRVVANSRLVTYERYGNKGATWSDWDTTVYSAALSGFYTKTEVDSLVAAATSGARIWQTATAALAKNTYNKIDFSVIRTLTLPAAPNENDYVAILKTGGSTVGSKFARNARTIMDLAEDMTIDRDISYLRLDYVAGSWRIAS